MDDDSDDCFLDDNGGLWVYVDEHYDEAEELAEHACPSPPYTQEITADDDYDRYDIWEDLEYMSDGWYDADTEQKRKADPKEGATGAKRKSPPMTRKRKAAENSQVGARKRRGNTRVTEANGVEEDDKYMKPPVLWMSQTERLRSPSVLSASTHEGRQVALLKNWRQSCPPQIPQRKQTKSHDVTNNNNLRDSEEPSEPVRKPSAVEIEDERIHVESHETADEEGDQGEEGFKLDLQSVASMLSEDQLNAIKGQLREKGLDPSALETVLKDIMEGREPDLDVENAAEGEDDVDDEEEEGGDGEE